MMNITAKLFLCAFVCYTIVHCGVLFSGTCTSPQYLEFGKNRTVNCCFEKKFYSVLWYTAKDFENDIPTIQYQQNIKSGKGYESGEYDIHPNGSLFIYNVSLSHNTNFTVAYIEAKTQPYKFITVEVVVVVKPAVPFPIIRSCGEVSNKCYAKRDDDDAFQCSIRGARPSIILEFMARTVEGDKDILEERRTIFENGEYGALATTREVFRYSSCLVLLVCKADAAPGLLEHNESLILVQNVPMEILGTKILYRYVERNRKIVLSCAKGDAAFVVWKKRSSFEYNVYEDLLYYVLIEEKFMEIFAENINVTRRGSLVIPRVEVKHEGMYVCVSGDGVSDSTIAYKLDVIVYPNPAYPVITGCSHRDYCELRRKYQGNLTCEVKGIRPQIKLEWKIPSQQENDKITFPTHQLTVEDNGETFDVTLISTYDIQDQSLDRMTVECNVLEPSHTKLKLSRKFDLIFMRGSVNTTGKIKIPVTPRWVIPVILLLLIVILVLLTVFGICICKQRQARPRQETDEELGACLLNSSQLATFTDGSKETFIKQLKEQYKDQYNAVQPIPYIKDKMYCVNKVFVEGTLQFLDNNFEGETRKKWWRKLSSYQDVFTDDRLFSQRRIVEGDPGFGKSTIMLQFAYDWCNSDKKSFLEHVEILIFLKLRQLGGVTSIYDAIRRFILPKDTTLSSGDIERILQGSHSVVILLDGYDEYPDQTGGADKDVENIIKRRMFQNFEVILTTRTSVLPKDYPGKTKRVKLTGFDDNSRRDYIRKAVVDNEKTVLRIERYLRVNLVLKDLCQVPLLFVIFAHMTYENTEFQNLNSATNFFRYMISTFHSHMRNKMNCENVREYKLLEENHIELDQIAFEALSGNTEKLVWKKEDISTKTGDDFYEQYKRIGILFEEKVLEVNDDASFPVSEHMKERTEVQFYHKLFCEWYAAHHLSYLLQEPDANSIEILHNFDPLNLQYVFRFACGLNPVSAKKIIEYINTIEGGDKFAMLCILEQSGKFDNIESSVIQLCKEGVIISGHDNLLLQRSTVQLVELATKNDIPIDYIDLDDCLESVDCSSGKITVTSKLTLMSSILVKTLRISLYVRDMSEKEATDILKFSSKCPALKCLKFTGCIPARSFKVDKILEAVESKDITVRWKMFEESEWFVLDLQTGRWKRGEDGSEPTDEEFDFMASQLEQQRKEWNEDTLKEDVTRGREKLRKRLEEGRGER